MYNLAILTDTKKEKMIPPIGSKLNLVYSFDENQVLNQLVNVDGVLVTLSALEKATKIYEFMIAVNRNKQLPVWVQTETKNEGPKNNRVLLELGALGYLDENVSDEENFVLIENTLRLISSKEPEKAGEQTHELNLANRTFQIGDKEPVHMTNMECKLMNYLYSEVNQAFTYEEIYKEVWEEKVGLDQEMKRYRIANMVFHIRTKLENQGYSPTILQTVRSRGYMLNVNE